MAFTSGDKSDAVVVCIAKEIYHAPKVVTRLYDREEAEIYKCLGMQTLFFTTWGIECASDLLSCFTSSQVYNFSSGEAELVCVKLPTLLAEHRMNELMVVDDIYVIAIERDNKTPLPMTGMVL